MLGGANIDWAALALVLIAIAMAGLGLVTALAGRPELGVIADLPGGNVQQVDPGSFAWLEGIRPGQIVLAMTPSNSAGGAALVVEAGDREIAATERAAAAHLRDTIWAAAAGLLLALFALITFPRHARRASALAALAVASTSVTLTVASPSAIEVPARLLSLAAPTVWIARRGGGAVLRAALASALAILLVGWCVAWISAPELFDRAEGIRSAGVVAACGVVLLLQLDLPALASRLRSTGGLRALDLLALALGFGLFSGLWWLVRVPALIAVGVVALGVIAYPRVRRLLLDMVDRLLLAEMRDEMRLEAAESERARLARDLHDVPLQELAAVIRRLDPMPEAEAEVFALRDVADHLRSVATELRSPVLDDLGIVPAIEYLAGQLGSQAAPFSVEAHLANECGVARDRRPPAVVEVAAFRIVQEALANAIRHSGGTRVTLSGRVSPDHIVLSVSDDGTGLRRDAVEHAIRQGHMGTTSMRQRARSIDAALRLQNAKDGGLAVRLKWPA